MIKKLTDTSLVIEGGGKTLKGIVAIAHQKGGVGKSTTFWNVTTEYAEHQPIDIIDLDVQKTITYSLENRERNYKKLKNINLLNVRDKNDRVDDKLMMDLMTQSHDADKLLFIDCGGFDSSSNRLAMAAANVLLTPVSSKFYELLGLRKFETILKELTEEFRGDQKLVSNVFLNKINPNTRALDEVTEFINGSEYFNLMNSILRQRVDYEDSPALGQNVMEYNKYGKAAEEILAFKRELDNILDAY